MINDLNFHVRTNPMKQNELFWNRSRKWVHFLQLVLKVYLSTLCFPKVKLHWQEKTETRLSLLLCKEWPSWIFECRSSFEHQYALLLSWSFFVMQLESIPFQCPQAFRFSLRPNPSWKAREIAGTDLLLGTC